VEIVAEYLSKVQFFAENSSIDKLIIFELAKVISIEILEPQELVFEYSKKF